MLDRHEEQAAAGWVPPDGACLDHVSLPERVRGRNELFPALIGKWLREQDNCFEMQYGIRVKGLSGVNLYCMAALVYTDQDDLGQAEAQEPRAP